MVQNQVSPGLLQSIRSSVKPGEGGRPKDVPIGNIDPDPDQPRKQFDEPSLEAMAETMRQRGVLQPILLRKSPKAGRWIIVHGERRWRAAKLAGLATIPAFEGRVTDGNELTPDQVIENQHRASLSNTELAKAIKFLTAEKEPTKDIAIICNIPEQQVKLYRAILKLPDALAPWADRLEVRTVYELYLAWQKQGEKGRGAIERRLSTIPDSGSLSLADARRVIKSVQSVPLVQKDPPPAPPADASAPSDGAKKEEWSVDPRDRMLWVGPATKADLRTGRTTDAAPASERRSLQCLILRLSRAMDDAAEELDMLNPQLAHKLREQAQEAKDELDGLGVGETGPAA